MAPKNREDEAMNKNKFVKTVGRCPACESTEMLAFDGDFFCLECDWNSLKISVERGDLTELINAWDEMQEEECNSALSKSGPKFSRPQFDRSGGSAA